MSAARTYGPAHRTGNRKVKVDPHRGARAVGRPMVIRGRARGKSAYSGGRISPNQKAHKLSKLSKLPSFQALQRAALTGGLGRNRMYGNAQSTILSSRSPICEIAHNLTYSNYYLHVPSSTD